MAINIYKGLTIGGKHTYRDFGLLMSSYYIPEPKTKITRLDLPFSSGSIDLTEATGNTPYEDRNGLEFSFSLMDGGHERFALIVQELSMFLHGKKLQMISDYDPGYYYLVRLEVNPQKTSRLTGTITLSGISDPFKYNVLASNEPWEWDPFNFVNGVIQDTSDITINGTRSINIVAGGVPTCPEFYVSNITGSLSVTYNNKTYQFSNGIGNYRFPQLTIAKDDATLVFSGRGKVSISYRGRYL